LLDHWTFTQYLTHSCLPGPHMGCSASLMLAEAENDKEAEPARSKNSGRVAPHEDPAKATDAAAVTEDAVVTVGDAAAEAAAAASDAAVALAKAKKLMAASPSRSRGQLPLGDADDDLLDVVELVEPSAGPYQVSDATRLADEAALHVRQVAQHHAAATGTPAPADEADDLPELPDAEPSAASASDSAPPGETEKEPRRTRVKRRRRIRKIRRRRRRRAKMRTKTMTMGEIRLLLALKTEPAA